MHLIRSDQCRSYLLLHGGRHHPAPGLGSSTDSQRLSAHDNKLPPQQALGPLKPTDRARDLSLVHWELHDAIAESLFTCASSSNLEPDIRALILDAPISWTQCVLTLRELATTVREEREAIGVLDAEDILTCLSRLMQSSSWSFLQHPTVKSAKAQICLEDWEQACAHFVTPAHQPVPRPLGIHRVILHAYSGRRRAGDLQFFLEALHHAAEDGTLLHVVSLDLMTDPLWGDATRTRDTGFLAPGCGLGLRAGLFSRSTV